MFPLLFIIYHIHNFHISQINQSNTPQQNLLSSNSEYTISTNAKSHLTGVFEQLYENKTKDFGNGRLVRNIFEKSIEIQSNRIALADTLTKEILSTIETEDIPSISTYTS